MWMTKANLNCTGISLLLLQVFSVLAATTLSNVALNGTAAQSSTFPGQAAQKAIDGSRDPHHPSCTHTLDSGQADPWWRVDLPGVHRVTVVKVTNRADCCSKRLDGAEILIGNSQENNGNNNPRCAVISNIPPGKTYTFQCGGMEGRFVNVFIPGAARVLTLCEVEVYGESVPPPPSISKLLGDRMVTVVGKRLCWSDALIYCRDFYWDLLSLHSQEDQREVEELLGLASFPLTSHLWLGLRRYLMGDQWFWMSGNHMNYSQWEGGSAPWMPCSPCGGLANGKLLLWGDRSCDEHLNFICYTGAKVLRVDFYSTYTHTLRP